MGSHIHHGVQLGREEMDILDPEQIQKKFEEIQPEIVFHCAVNINMQDCEDNPEKAFHTNVQGTKNIAEACKKTGAYMIHLSSNSVFSGNKNAPYFEDDIPDPVNVYGKTKLESEKIVAELLPDALIARTSWLFSKGPRSETKFTEICFKKLKAGEEVKAISDRFGSPTYIPDMLEALYDLVSNRENGIFHIANSGMVTYYDMALAIKEKGQLSGSVVPVTAETYPSSVPRKPMEALASKFIRLRPWTEAVGDYLSVLTSPN